MIYMGSKKLLPFHAQQSTYLSTMQLHKYKFLVFREPFDFILHDMNGIGILSQDCPKMQQCPEKTIQLERFCYPNQKTKQGIFDRESFIRPCDKQQTTNFPNFVFSKVRYVQKFFFSIVISSCDQDYQISVWLKPLKDCGCAKLN